VDLQPFIELVTQKANRRRTGVGRRSVSGVRKLRFRSFWIFWILRRLHRTGLGEWRRSLECHDGWGYVRCLLDEVATRDSILWHGFYPDRPDATSSDDV